MGMQFLLYGTNQAWIALLYLMRSCVSMHPRYTARRRQLLLRCPTSCAHAVVCIKKPRGCGAFK